MQRLNAGYALVGAIVVLLLGQAAVLWPALQAASDTTGVGDSVRRSSESFTECLCTIFDLGLRSLRRNMVLTAMMIRRHRRGHRRLDDHADGVSRHVGRSHPAKVTPAVHAADRQLGAGSAHGAGSVDRLGRRS